MFDLSGIYGLISLVTGFFPFLLVISLILLFIAGILSLFPNRSKLTRALRIDKYFVVPLILLSLAFAGGQPGSATAFGTLTVDGGGQLFGGSVATLKVTGMTVGSEYTIYATNCAAGFTNITFISTAATQYIPVGVPNEADKAFTWNIDASTSGATAGTTAATLFVSLSDPTPLLPTDLLFTLMVPIIIFALMVYVVRTIVKSGFGGSGKKDKYY